MMLNQLNKKRMEAIRMETYLGCKIIKGAPMTFHEFMNKVKGQQVKHEDTPGYLVEYEDGYQSWSPKDTFERAYRRLSEGEMKLLQE